MSLDKSKRGWYLAVAYFVAAFIFIVPVMHWPVTVLLAAYAVFGAVCALVNRESIVAHIGVNMLANGQRARAAELFDRAIARGTKNASVYLHRAIILVRDGDAATALGYLNKALTLKPGLLVEKNTYLTMGSCYWVLGEIDRAVEVLEGMRTRYEYVNNHVLTTLGYMYILKKDYARATELTELAITEAPDSAAAWDNLGQIHYGMGELDKAAAAFTKAVGLKDDLVDSHYYLGMIAAAQNDRARALACFRKADSCGISALNTVTKEQIIEKLGAYASAESGQTEEPE